MWRGIVKTLQINVWFKIHHSDCDVIKIQNVSSIGMLNKEGHIYKFIALLLRKKEYDTQSNMIYLGQRIHVDIIIAVVAKFFYIKHYNTFHDLTILKSWRIVTETKLFLLNYICFKAKNIKLFQIITVKILLKCFDSITNWFINRDGLKTVKFKLRFVNK